MKTVLHHFAYNISPNNLELVVELFELLGCQISYREDNARWCMLEQKPIPVDIQIIEVSDNTVSIDKKKNTHIAFLSDNPKSDIEQIEKWVKQKNINFIKGQWQPEMLWFDLPNIFVNFVVEIMDELVVK